MTTPTTNLTLTAIQTEFGGATPIKLSEYYRGGSFVSSSEGTSVQDGTAISTSGTIRMGMFRGLSAVVPENVSVTAVNSVNSDAAFYLFANGTAGTTGTNTAPSPGNETYVDNWYTPTTNGISSSYYTNWSVVSGVSASAYTTYGGAGVWTGMASAGYGMFTLNNYNPGTTESGVLKILISSSPTGTPVIGTWNVSFTSTVNNGVTPGQTLSYTAQRLTTGAALCMFELATNGNTFNDSGTFSSTEQSLFGPNWYNQPVTGIGSSYWLKATKVSGTVTIANGAAFGTWQNIGTNQPGWQVNSSSTGTKNVTGVVQFQISSSSTGTPVLATWNITLTAISP